MPDVSPRVAPASSFPKTDSSSLRPGLLGVLTGAFEAVRNFVAPSPVPYRELLGPQEQGVYDAFQAYRAEHPDHRVLLVASRPCGEIFFEGVAGAEEANDKARGILARKTGQFVLTALDLTQSFESQWTKKPGGHDSWIDLFKHCPKALAPGVVLPPRFPHSSNRKPS
jgi:hypothetical protein